MSPRTPPGEANERLHTLQAFRRFVARVTPCALRWLVRWGVPARDRDDVLQDALVEAYRRRDSYDPARGRHEDWAFGYVGQVVRNYRKRTARRMKRVDVARGELPDVAADVPGPEEETDDIMKRRMLERCLAGIDDDSRAILLARAEGIPMADIARALGVAESTAYVYCRDARAQVQEALDREQRAKRALGVAVLPLSMDQLLATEGPPPEVPAETMQRVWRTLDRVMDADLATGKLTDDGTDAPRYMGADPGPRAEVGMGARIQRLLADPRVSHALTAIFSAVGGALLALQVTRGAPGPRDTAIQPGPNAGNEVVSVASPAVPPTVETPAPSAAQSSSRAGAATEPRADAGSTGGSAVDHDDLDEPAEHALFEKGVAAYQGRLYADAIKTFQEHAARHPRGRFAGNRERLLILALIGAGRPAEARHRVEELRRISAANPVLKELDAALQSAN